MMEDYANFKKLVEWMFEKHDISTNDILEMSSLTLGEYAALVEADPKELAKIKPSSRAKIQDFVKKHWFDYHMQTSGKLDPEYDEEVVVVSPDPPPEKTDAEKQSEAINKLIYNPTKEEKRKIERAQEKIFYEQLQRLHDVVPDHITFDIILKRK